MICRDSSLLISAQLDGRASVREEQELEAHLSDCAACRLRAVELDCLRQEMRALGPAQPSTEMATAIITALQQEARLQARAVRRRADLLDAWRTRLFSQSIGTVISFALFAFLVAVIIRPIYRAIGIDTVVAAAVYTDNTEEIRKLRLALLPPLPNKPKPVFDPSGALLGFSKSFSGDDELIVTVSVQEDGTASVENVVESPRDPAMIRHLSNALLKDMSFQPAGRRGRFVKSNAVLMFSKVNIPG